MRIALAVAAVALALGCGGSLSDRDDLIAAVSQLNDDLRWGRWDSASTWMAEPARRDFMRNLRTRTHGGALQTADVEVLGLRPLPGGKAIVRVERAWYLLTDSELHQGQYEQKWQRIRGEWRLVAERELLAQN